jgi:hypothetical protein
MNLDKETKLQRAEAIIDWTDGWRYPDLMPREYQNCRTWKDNNGNKCFTGTNSTYPGIYLLWKDYDTIQTPINQFGDRELWEPFANRLRHYYEPNNASINEKQLVYQDYQMASANIMVKFNLVYLTIAMDG